MIKILLIDDDVEFCELLSNRLTTEGFETSVAHSGNTGIELSFNNDFSIILLDVMLPGVNGYDVLKEIRKEISIPIIMLTARGDEVDRVIGLELGADDYIPKPFSSRELVARIRAVLRRSSNAIKLVDGKRLNNININGLILDHNKSEATYQGVDLMLTHIEYSIVELLAQHHCKVVSRDEISKIVFGRELNAFDRSIDFHICNIRRKFISIASLDNIIKSVRSIGYSLII